MPGLQPGRRAPGFTLPDAAGREVHFTPERMDGDTVLVSYPGDFSQQAHRFLHQVQRRLPTFHDYRAEVLAISMDGVDTAKGTAARAGPACSSRCCRTRSTAWWTRTRCR